MAPIANLQTTNASLSKTPSSLPINKIVLVAGVIFIVIVATAVYLRSRKKDQPKQISQNKPDYEQTVRSKDSTEIKTAIANGLDVNKSCLVKIAMSRNDAIANLFAEKIADVNTLIDSDPILVKAIAEGFDKTACTLIQRGAKTDDASLIHLAVDKTLEQTVAKLAEDQALLEAPYSGKTPLQYAIDRGKDATAAALVRAKADCTLKFGGQSIHRAVKNSHMSDTERALKEMDIPMLDEGPTSTDWKKLPQAKKNNDLTNALGNENFTLAAQCIRSGADPDTVFRKMPALCIAIEKDKPELFNACLAKDADLHATHTEYNPLLYALQREKHGKNEYNYTRQLIQAGADPNVRIDEKPLLFIAINEPQPTLLQACLDSKKISLTVRYNNQTPLEYAIEKGKIEYAKLLFDKDKTHYMPLLESEKFALIEKVLIDPSITALGLDEQMLCLHALDRIPATPSGYITKQLHKLDETPQKKLLAQDNSLGLAKILFDLPVAAKGGYTISQDLLWRAHMAGDLDFIAKLIRFGADTDDLNFEEPLIFQAILSESPDLFEACVEKPEMLTLRHPDDKQTPLEYALTHQKFDRAQKLYVKTGAKDVEPLLTKGDRACLDLVLKKHSLSEMELKTIIAAFNHMYNENWHKRLDNQFLKLNPDMKQAVFISDELKPCVCNYLLKKELRLPPKAVATKLEKIIKKPMDEKEQLEFVTSIYENYQPPESFSWASSDLDQNPLDIALSQDRLLIIQYFITQNLFPLKLKNTINTSRFLRALASDSSTASAEYNAKAINSIASLPNNSKRFTDRSSLFLKLVDKSNPADLTDKAKTCMAHARLRKAIEDDDSTSAREIIKDQPIQATWYRYEKQKKLNSMGDAIFSQKPNMIAFFAELNISPTHLFNPESTKMFVDTLNSPTSKPTKNYIASMLNFLVETENSQDTPNIGLEANSRTINSLAHRIDKDNIDNLLDKTTQTWITMQNLTQVVSIARERLHEAIEQGSPQTPSIYGTFENTPFNLSEKDGYTPLDTALKFNKEEFVEYFVNKQVIPKVFPSKDAIVLLLKTLKKLGDADFNETCPFKIGREKTYHQEIIRFLVCNSAFFGSYEARSNDDERQVLLSDDINPLLLEIAGGYEDGLRPELITCLLLGKDGDTFLDTALKLNKEELVEYFVKKQIIPKVFPSKGAIVLLLKTLKELGDADLNRFEIGHEKTYHQEIIRFLVCNSACFGSYKLRPNEDERQVLLSDDINPLLLEIAGGYEGGLRPEMITSLLNKETTSSSNIESV